MTLQEFIKREGPYKIALQLDISHVTVYRWSRMIGAPNADSMYRIVQLSKGEVTYQEIVEPYMKYNNRI